MAMLLDVLRRLSSGLASVTNVAFTDTNTDAYKVGGSVTWATWQHPATCHDMPMHSASNRRWLSPCGTCLAVAFFVLVATCALRMRLQI